MGQATGAGQVLRQHFPVKPRKLRGRPLLSDQRAPRAVVLATCGSERLFGGPVALLDVGHTLGQRIDRKRIDEDVHHERHRERHHHAAVLGNSSPHKRHAVKVLTHGALFLGTSRGGWTYVPSITASKSPCSVVRSSVVSTSRKPPCFSSASTNLSRSSTRRASALTPTTKMFFSFRRGCTLVIRMSSGSVASNRLRSSVHEKARRSMMPFASRAARDTASSSFVSICVRIRAASARRRCASRSESSACEPSAAWLADSRVSSTALKTENPSTSRANAP